MSIPVATPVDSGERLAHVDALRGFALLGILLVNMDFHSAPAGEPVPVEPVHYAASTFVTFFCEGKFYPLFSMLFGFGLALQSSRASGGWSFALRWTRRQVALFAFGFAHALLLWPGDILATYAIIGMLALPFIWMPPRWLPAIGAAVWSIGTLWWSAIFGMLALVLAFAADDASVAGMQRALTDETVRIYSTGTFLEMTRQRAHDYVQLIVATIVSGHVIFTMFLFGLWAGLTGLLRDLVASRAFLERAMAAGIAFGLPFAVAMAWLSPYVSNETTDASFAVYLFAGMVGGPALAMGWAATFLRFASARLITLLAPAGRMALSNYLGQSLVCAALFQSWGLGLYGTTNDAFEVVLSVVIFGAQVSLSRVWMTHFQFGPMEWLWRAITYLTIPPMRR